MQRKKNKNINQEWIGKDFGKKREGRKNARAIGDYVEIKGWHFFRDKGFLAIRVPPPKKKSKQYWQQKGLFQKWDLLVVREGIVVQFKRRKKYMTRSEIDILKSSCKQFPLTKLYPEFGWLEKGLRFRNL